MRLRRPDSTRAGLFRAPQSRRRRNRPLSVRFASRFPIADHVPVKAARRFQEVEVIRRLVVFAATVWVVGVSGFIGATANQMDLTEKPPVQDALVDFGHPVHPQPPAPAHHHLYPDDVTIFKGGTVTFTVHGMGHGARSIPSARTRPALTLPRTSARGSQARRLRTQRPATSRTQRRPCRTRSPTGTARLSSTLLSSQPRDKSTPLWDSSSQPAGFQVYC